MSRRASAIGAGVAGLVSAGVALGLGELLAGLSSAVPSPLASVGGFVVDHVPGALKEFAISVFGTGDKGALTVGTVLISLGIGWLAGVVACRWFIAGASLFVVFGGLGLVAGLGEPLINGWATAGAAVAAAGAGIGTLWVLLRMALYWEVAEGDEVALDPERRRFLGMAAAAGLVAAGAGAVGRWLIGGVSEPPAADGAVLSSPVLPRLDPSSSFDVPDLTPIVVPNEEFFRIDTSLSVPEIDADTWSLRVGGLTDRQLELSYRDLLDMPLVEDYITLACVSNGVGGDLVGNARWAGVRLSEILDQAGVQPAGTQVVGRSIDGFTVGFPTELVFDGREPLVALGMNGEPLPREHGYPARLIVPGLFGYVSATKWLTEIELAGWDDFDAYWVVRRWAKEAPMKLQSRIDVPGRGRQVEAGTLTVAGVAWAALQGIGGVEVSLDGGPWTGVDLSTPLSDKSWVQWRGEIEVAAGEHSLEVRAIGGDGEIQTAERTAAMPDGATGHHVQPFNAV
jgi:DMSO/TMAO reductase YedYZ molybdopterin-dependent catalytic subunit